MKTGEQTFSRAFSGRSNLLRTTLATLGIAGVAAGCGGPEKPKTIEEMLRDDPKAAAADIGRAVLRKEFDAGEIIIKKDPEIEGGAYLSVEKAQGPYTASIEVSMQARDGQLDPSTTYEVIAEETSSVRLEDAFCPHDGLDRGEYKVDGAQLGIGENPNNIVVAGNRTVFSPTFVDELVGYNKGEEIYKKVKGTYLNSYVYFKAKPNLNRISVCGLGIEGNNLLMKPTFYEFLGIKTEHKPY